MSNPTELPDLLPCPFCAGAARFERTGNWHDLFVAHVGDCYLSGEGAEMSYLDSPDVQERMASKWNCRAQPEGEAPQADVETLLYDHQRAVEGVFEHGETGGFYDDLEASRDAIRDALSDPAASLSPLCGAQPAESGKEVELPLLPAPVSSVDAWVKRGHDGAAGNESLEPNGEYFTGDQMLDYARAAIAAQQAAAPGALDDLDFTPDAHHQVADMANVGYELMQTIKALRPDYCWNDTPAEIVSDLINELDEATTSAPGTPEATAEDRKGIELWRATLRACGELPEGYEVRIELENGCGMAVWYDAEGERHVIDGEGYLSDDVNEAVDAAIQSAAQLDGGQEGSE